MHRPHLDQRSGSHGDYINAVFVDVRKNFTLCKILMIHLQSFRSQNASILTQMPLPSTVSDFLNMIYRAYGTQPNAIVMLNGVDDEDPVSYDVLADILIIMPLLCVCCRPWVFTGPRSRIHL